MEEFKPTKSEETPNTKNPPEPELLSQSSDSSDEDEELATVIVPSSHEPSHDDSLYIIDSIAKRKDTLYLGSLVNSLREISLFPIFGDMKLAKISVNYFLYLEFFHGIIRTFGYIFLFFVLTFPLPWLIPKFLPEEYSTSIRVQLEVFFAMIGLIMLKFLTRKELQRLAEEKVLYESQWSEDMFSVLVEGLPLDVTKEEISLHFKSLLSQDYHSARLVDVIYLHDYKRYFPIKKKLEKSCKKLKERNEKGVNSGDNDKLLKEIEKLQRQIDQMNQEISQMKHFRGKIIVIFESIGAQNEIVQHFSYGRVKSLLISCFKSHYKQHYVRNHRMTVKTLPEPRDLQFQNLHYPKFTKRIRTIIGSITSYIFINLGLAAFAWIQFQRLEKNPKLTEYVLPIGTFLLCYFLEKGHKLFQKFYVHKSALDSKLDALNYYYRISSWIYISTQIIFAARFPENLPFSLLSLMLIYCLKTILVQLLQIYSTNKTLKKISETNSNSLVSGLLRKVTTKYVEFDFVKGLSRALPPLFIGSAFLVVKPIFLLPVLIGILYIIAVFDKYKIIKTCNLFSAKSAYYMLKPFWVYNWIPILGFGFNVARIQSTYPELFQMRTTVYFVCIAGSIGFLTSCFFPKPLRTKVRERFVEMNGSVLYESVSASFSSSFRKKDPYHQNKFTTTTCHA